METLKNNIQEVLTTEFTSVYRISSLVGKNLSIEELDLSTETKIAYQLADVITSYASARKYAWKSLNNLIHGAQETKQYLERGFQCDSGFLDSSKYDTYNNESKKYENEIKTLLYVAGVPTSLIPEFVAKINNTIEWK